ncbi:NTP pyrophosphohydrolase, partial [Microbacterium sp. LMI1-1-1.1]|uniref:NTP pyrophosphohydrolase n=1 Tax=Microbacterium sp. LMI1-1-1.1 TaxID=3135223 RepID=UPI003467B7F3
MTTALTGAATPAAPAGPGSAGPATANGRIDVADRVYRKAAEQAAADAIGIDRTDVKIDITGSRDTVIVRVSAPFPIPRLDDTPAVNTTVPVLEAARGI